MISTILQSSPLTPTRQRTPSRKKTPTTKQEIYLTALHVILDFSLNDNGIPRNPTSRELKVLETLYPTQVGVGIEWFFLVLVVKVLPPRPWPLTVAGLPLFITTDVLRPVWNPGRPASSRLHVLEDLDATLKVTDKCFESTIAYFEGKSINITSILWFSGIWRITIKDSTDISTLPFRICRAATVYKFDSSTTEPCQAAYRVKQPSVLVHDDSVYSILRPGIMVSSQTLCSTSGVLVKNSEGQTFMTVASHGFPQNDAKVFHPSPNGTHIGDVVNRLGQTDIALVQLQQDFQFENYTFQSSSGSSTHLHEIRDGMDMKLGDSLTMDNPYTGAIDAVCAGRFWAKYPDPGKEAHVWVKQDWDWFGQHVDDFPVAESCGSALWDDDGKLVCFFRYLIVEGADKGFGIGAAASEMKQYGYDIA